VVDFQWAGSRRSALWLKIPCVFAPLRPCVKKIPARKNNF
jgi:hypothetical protein